MAKDEMVKNFWIELQQFAEALDHAICGLTLCMVYQTNPSFNTRSWTLCVSSESLDTMSERKALSSVNELLEKSVSEQTRSAIERLIVLRTYEPQADELLWGVQTVDDASLLVGKKIFGRLIARAHILLLRQSGYHEPLRQTVRV